MSSQINVTDYGSTTGKVAWQTVSVGEWVSVAIGSLSILLILIACGWIVYMRNYPPIKAKQWPLMILSGISGAIFFFGAVITLRIFPNTGPFLQNCNFFFFWMYGTFGILLWLDTSLFRMLRLWWILIIKKDVSWLLHIGGFLLLYALPLLFAIIGTIAKLDGPTVYEGIPTCKINSAYNYFLYIIILLKGLAFAYFSWALRNCPKKIFQEYSSNRNCFAVFAISFIIVIITFSFDVQNQAWGRIFGLFFYLLMINTYFYGTLGSVLYYSIFHPKEYETKFWELMNSDVSSNARSPKFQINPKQNSKQESIDMEPHGSNNELQLSTSGSRLFPAEHLSPTAQELLRSSNSLPNNSVLNPVEV